MMERRMLVRARNKHRTNARERQRAPRNEGHRATAAERALVARRRKQRLEYFCGRDFEGGQWKPSLGSPTLGAFGGGSGACSMRSLLLVMSDYSNS